MSPLWGHSYLVKRSHFNVKEKVSSQEDKLEKDPEVVLPWTGGRDGMQSGE